MRTWLWRRRRRRLRKEGASDGPRLREFVYLDDVSVYSLLASRGGAVAEEITETASSSLKTEFASTAGVNVPVIKAEARSRFEGSASQGSEVVRKMSAQARFKQLLDDERPTMALCSIPRTKAPDPRSAADLLRFADSGDYPDWVLDLNALERGDMLECEVELAAEKLYGISQTVSSLLTVFERDPAAFGLDSERGLRDAQLMTSVLDAMLVGLVPIRAPITSHAHVVIDSRSLLVRRSLLDGLREPLSAVETPSFPLVGVTDLDLYWKDVRRILFAGNRCQVLFRMSRPGVVSDWTPIKLTDVLREVAPPLAAQLDGAGRSLTQALQDSRSEAAAGEDDDIDRALLSYLRCFDGSFTEQDVVQASLTATVPGRRARFNAVRDWLGDRGHEIDRDDAARAYSGIVLALEDGDRVADLPLVPDTEPGAGSDEELCLDAEIIAFYW